MTRSKAHDGRGHTFIGVPVATCVVEGCTETREVSQYPVTARGRFSIAIRASEAFTQIGEDPYGVLDPTMGPYADEGVTDPQGPS